MSQSNESTYSQRLAALKLLRETIFLDNPNKYSATDIAEDFPGQLKNVTHILKNVLPSRAIISKDPEERKQQILKAVQKIKQNQKTEKSLPYKEMLTNAGAMAASTVAPSIALSGLIGLLNFRKPWTRAGNKLKFRSPVAPLQKIQELKTKKHALREFLLDVRNETLGNAAMAGGVAALTPLLSAKLNISDSSLNDAANILQNQPQITSLPASEALSAMYGDKENSKLKNTLSGAGIGAGLGILGILPNTLVKTIGSTIANKSLKGLGKHLINHFKTDATTATLGGGIIGGMGGYLTDRFNKKNHEKDSYD